MPPVVRLLAVADEKDPRLNARRLRELDADFVISCGDLNPDYLDFVSSAANAPLLYVPGNHDPDHDRTPARFDGMITNQPPPPGGRNLDGRVLDDGGLRFAGFGGSVRYRPGDNQYTQGQMKRRVSRLIVTERLRGLGRARPIDVLVTHAPPLGLGDDDDPAHEGFDAFHRLIDELAPRLMLHGHIHPYGFAQPDRQIGDTTVVNVIPHRVLEIPAQVSR